MRKKKVLVAGAGGFIGHNLVKYLKGRGYWVRGADIKKPEFEESPADEFMLLDLRISDNCMQACSGMEEIYQLAADMGGIGYITVKHAVVLRNNALINLQMLEAARLNNLKGYLFSSSACVYPGYLQNDSRVKKLKEEDAYPADAEAGYGWEKLFTELACQYYNQDYGFRAHIARFHNIYGPYNAYKGGREKSPAAICRKIILAKNADEIEVWGDGKQTRSYCYVDDCVAGIYLLMQSDFFKPLNIGSKNLVPVNQLVDIIARIAGKKIKKRHDLSKPQGVRGRNADINLAKKVIGWQPRVSLEKGLEMTYKWIAARLSATRMISK